MAAIRRITQRLEALPVASLRAPAIDPRTCAVAALMVANYVGDEAIHRPFDALVHAGLLDEHAVTDLPVLARFVLRVLPKLGPDLVERTTAAPDHLDRVCRAHREDLLSLAERHLDDIDEAHGRISAVKQGRTAADVVHDLRVLADLCQDYADVLARDKAAFTPALATRARELADRLEEAILGPEPEEQREWRVYLLRAWSSLVATYGEVCRAGRFLLPHEKPEARFPSLAAVMRVRRRTRNEGGRLADSQIDPAAARSAQPRAGVASPMADGSTAVAAPVPAAAAQAAPAPTPVAVPAIAPPPPSAAATVPAPAIVPVPAAVTVPAPAPASPWPSSAPSRPPPPATGGPAPVAFHGQPPPPPAFPAARARQSMPELHLVDAGPARTSRDEAGIAALMDRQRGPLASVDIDAEALTDPASLAEVHAAVAAFDEIDLDDCVAVALDVGFTTESNFYEGLAGGADIGLFMATYVVKPPGTHLAISLGLPGLAEPFDIQGVVRWVREFSPAIETSPGMGIVLEGLTDEERAAIQRFIAQRPPLFFDE